MNRRNQRKIRKLASQATELSFAAPQVAAHRMGRMALAGNRPSGRDAAEFQRMGAEKATAFFAAWNAMAMNLLRTQQAWAAATVKSLASLTPIGLPAMATMWQTAGLGLLASGLAPVHGAATANARRLAAVPMRKAR